MREKNLNIFKVDYKTFFYSRGLIQFIIKLVLIWLLFSLMVVQVSNMISKSLSSTKNDSTDKKVLVYAKGLINNPEVFFQTSILHEKSNKLENAIADMELALGLLEMQKTSVNYQEKFKKRLQELQELKKLNK